MPHQAELTPETALNCESFVIILLLRISEAMSKKMEPAVDNRWGRMAAFVLKYGMTCRSKAF